MDKFDLIWAEQLEQQRELRLAPSDLNDIERARLFNDLALHAVEEIGELGRAVGGYKRHLLARNLPDREEVADHIADVLKLTLAVAQTLGVDRDQVVRAFHRRTRAISAKAAFERVQLNENTKLICTDLDDVICDLVPWRSVLQGRFAEDCPAERLAEVERLKDEFYGRGRFLDMAPISGASEVLRALRNEGWKIVIITARPQWQFKRLYSDTVDWLNNHRIPFDGVIFSKDKVESLYEHIVPAWPSVFVEDHPRNIAALSDVGVRVLMYDQEHNRSVAERETVKRVRGWNEIAEILGVNVHALDANA